MCCFSSLFLCSTKDRPLCCMLYLFILVCMHHILLDCNGGPVERKKKEECLMWTCSSRLKERSSLLFLSYLCCCLCKRQNSTPPNVLRVWVAIDVLICWRLSYSTATATEEWRRTNIRIGHVFHSNGWHTVSFSIRFGHFNSIHNFLFTWTFQ